MAFDISELQGLLGQFGPTEEEKRAAKMQAIAQFGLGLLGTQKGDEWRNVGMSASHALAGQSDAIKQAQAQRMQNLQQATTLRTLMRKEGFARDLEGQLNGGGSSDPQVASGPGTPANSGTPSAPAQQSGNMVQQLLGMGVPQSAIRLAVQSDDPASALAKLAADFGKPHVLSPGQAVYSPGATTPLASAPNIDKGMRVGQGGNVEALPGYAQTTAQIAGATSGAQEQAKAQYDLVDVPDGRGGTFKVPRDMAVKLLGGQAPQGPQAQGGQRVNLNLQNASPADLAAILKDVQNPVPMNPVGSGRVGQAPSAVDVHAATSGIDTQQGAVRKGTEDFITNSYRPTIDNGRAARQANVNLDILEKLPISEKTGWGTTAKVTGARVLEGLGIAPDAAKQYASNAQVYNRAVNENLWNLLGTQKGVQSEGDAARAKATFASLENTPEANKYTTDLLRATNNLRVKQADFYSKHYAEALRTGRAYELESAWQQQAPSLWDDPAMSKWKNSGGAPAPSGGWSIKLKGQ
jgi:hypothetical protein